MKLIKKIYCVHCGAKNDINVMVYNDIIDIIPVEMVAENEPIRFSGKTICWYCKKDFKWKIKI